MGALMRQQQSAARYMLKHKIWIEDCWMMYLGGAGLCQHIPRNQNRERIKKEMLHYILLGKFPNEDLLPG